MKLEIKNEFLCATFSDVGAELISLKSDTKEYIWEGKSEFWGKHSPILFPIIGLIKNGTYYFSEKEYKLPQHGFAREKQFEVVEQSDNRIVFSLKNDAETLKVYPFTFELKIEYVLVGKKLDVKYWVQNNSNDKMFFSIGGHPGFRLSKKIDAYSLLFETNSEMQFSLLENGLLSDKKQKLKVNNNTLSLNYLLFEKDALVFRNQEIKSITIQENAIDLVKVHFEQFPDLGIWTKPNAPFICIEPWFGYADVVTTTQNLIEKAGIQMLEKEEIFTSMYTIEILN